MSCAVAKSSTAHVQSLYFFRVCWSLYEERNAYAWRRAGHLFFMFVVMSIINEHTKPVGHTELRMAQIMTSMGLGVLLNNTACIKQDSSLS